MKQQPVIGIDLGVISKSELAVADGSSIEFTRKVSSTPLGLTEGHKAAGGRQVAIVVEATAMAWFVAAVAAVRAGIDHTLYRASGAKSAALRTFYRSHTKTDRIDAKVLALMPAVDNSLRPLELPSAAQLSLKRLVGLRQKLTTAITKQQNQIRSTLHWAAPGLVKAAGGSVPRGWLMCSKHGLTCANSVLHAPRQSPVRVAGNPIVRMMSSERLNKPLSSTRGSWTSPMWL